MIFAKMFVDRFDYFYTTENYSIIFLIEISLFEIVFLQNSLCPLKKIVNF